jgi:hypothetical protein
LELYIQECPQLCSAETTMQEKIKAFTGWRLLTSLLELFFVRKSQMMEKFIYDSEFRWWASNNNQLYHIHKVEFKSNYHALLKSVRDKTKWGWMMLTN